MTIDPKRRKQRFSDNFYNTTTYIGVVLSLIVLFSETILFWVDFFSPSKSDYIGILAYLILPPLLVIGFILIPLGAKWKRERISKGLEDKTRKAIHIDLSNPKHQNALMIFLFVTIAGMLVAAICSYKAFTYTESDRFCGVACHQIMNPEYVAHMHSSHAKIKCVECHIGSGAGWYVHYKMAGVRMLLKKIQGTYARPIPTPVTTLRPAKEICEECHWPGKTYNAIQIKRTYFADDPSKTPKWTIQLLMHIGGKSKDSSGIHAHMYNDNEVYYAADDEKRQKISWVKTVSKSGEEKIYMTKTSPYKDKAPAPSKIRKMDCMDCHNRPAHHFEAPEVLINRALEDDNISPTIPMIKAKAVEVLSKEYKSEGEAVEKIESIITSYYIKSQVKYYATHQQKIKEAIAVIITLYKNNFFPEMKARWDVYPYDIGHRISNGCFRCHDDEHQSKSGEIIPRACTTCHTITEQGSGDNIQKNANGLDFQHPFEDDGSWKTMNCSDCHNGGA
ncbi:MAG: NapC/NirT family cytochrome c [Candidatus Omnitrophica bacterium]|nr:NapC/NirT family cytochrome c [Candidatus Omnitrophota bacterium]